MKNTNATLKIVIHTYPDILICIRKYFCPLNPHTSCLLCLFYGWVVGLELFWSGDMRVAHGQALMNLH